ncbi:NmrA/HSCARG family protein [Actinopolymorpha alba]|uniref:NmrA/HSCARG family protein n=1 Tax=Actinopolymorpha alba TaxID=533267 RepID=UPI00035CF26B|nr:NmrA/HSCARG family protein [Actinopolymorpha alba]
MTSKPIIVVAGATGSQGGGAITALLEDPQQRFAVRALTRDPQSPAALALAARGAAVVRADFTHPATLETAFAGAHGAFFVTNFWAHGSAAQETQEIANLAAASASTKLSHVVWSTLEDTRDLLPVSDPRMPVLQDAYNVPHFDAKGEGNRFFTDAGVPTTFLNTTFFYQGFIDGVGPRRGEDGVLALTLPLESGKRLAGVDVNDIGRTAFAILAAGDTYVGRTVSLAGDHLTGAEYADILGEVIGETVRFDAVPYDTFRTFPIPAALEVANMFQYYGDFDAQFTGARDLDELRRLNPALRDFRTWATENADALKAAIG